MNLWLDRLESEIGIIWVVSDGQSLCAVEFADYEARLHKLLGRRYRDYQLQDRVNDQGFSDRLREYLNGDLAAVQDLPVNPGGTVFQRQVWQGLRQIPPGETWSYGQLATHLGNPKACRAVGMANSLNPIAIVIPCHRVIGAKGKLTGYAGGLDRKSWLLNHESAR
jgi:methylated-DNA-[protein]-cysteine S-methyltransferase